MKSIEDRTKFEVFETVPDLYLILSPELTILNASNAYLKATMTVRSAILGKYIFEAFPDNPEVSNATGVTNLKFSLEQAMKNKRPHFMEVQRYDIKKSPASDEPFEIKYWSSVNIPVLNDDGQVEYIIHKVIDVSQEIQNDQDYQTLTIRSEQLVEQVFETKRQIQLEREKFYELFMQAPAMIAIVKGPELIFEFANPQYLKVAGRTMEIIGKPAKDVFPELLGQGVLDTLLDVYKTGKRFKGDEFLFKLDLHNTGIVEDVYINFVYEPYRDHNGEIEGILVHGIEATSQVQSRRIIEESEEKYRTLFNQMDQGFCIIDVIFNLENKPVDYRFLEVNPVFEKQTGLKDAAGKTALELLPDLESRWFDIYGKVALTGESIRFTEASEVMGRWFEVYAFRLGDTASHKVALLFTDITERKNAEKALKESEERLSRIVAGSNDGIWDWDFKNDITWWNDRYTEILGVDLPKEKRSLKSVTEYIHPDDQNIIPEALKAHLEQGKNFEPEFRLVRPSGEIKYILTKGKAVKDEQGTTTRLSGIITDITERKQAEEAYIKAEARRRRIEQSNIAGVFYWKMDGTITDANDAFLSMIGYSKEDLAAGSISFWNITPKEFEETDKALIEKELLPTGQYIGYEKQFIHKKGSLVDIYMSGAFLEGTQEEGVTVVLDITERKRYEQSLRESEERFHNLADTAPIYMAMADESGNAVYFNKPWLEWTGRTMEEMKGLGWLCTLHPDDAAKFERDFKNAFQNQTSINEQYRFRKADGEYRWMLAVGAPRITPDGRFVGYFGTYTDFHELKQAEENLTLKNEQLIRINNDLDNFIYTASHDLKAPMSNIEGLLNSLRDQILSEKNSIDSETDLLLQLMGKSIERFKDTIIDLTEITKVQKTLEEDIKEINFSQIVEDVKLSIYDKIMESEATIVTNFSSAKTIRFSKKNLKSVIYNLLSNAIKYRDEARPLQINIQTEMHEEYTLLKIKDNGLGIDEQNKSKMFSMFKRFHDHVEGTGIGLYIVKRIIDNAGGKIELESEVGKGTTFNIYLKNSAL